MPLIAFFQLGHYKLPAGAFDDVFLKALAQLGEQRLVSQNKPHIEHRGADGHIGAGIFDGLLNIARGVADLEPQIPQQIEDVLHHALAPGRLFVRQQEQQIYVRARGQHAPAITARCDHAHALGR